MKTHIGLLILADDQNKTPLANDRTDALAWWDVLPMDAKKQVLSEFGFDHESGMYNGWDELLTMYRSIHGSH